MGIRQFAGSTLELLVIGKKHHAQKVFPPWQQSVLTLMPPLRGFVERIVVTLTLVFDQMLQTDVPSNFETCLIENSVSSRTILPLPPVKGWMRRKSNT